jgi:LPXTG-site transpeptidase (sortase) family protein
MIGWNSRILNGIANGGLVVSVALAALPMGTRVYGDWMQTRERSKFSRAETVRKIERAQKAERWATPTRRHPWRTSVLQIPAIGVDEVVTEGADAWTLVIGPGHIPRSAGPGGAGNCIIAAHRNVWDSAFADLPKLRPGDKVYLTNSENRYAYVVDSSREVRTDDLKPLRTSREARLTLITCVLPFNAHKRWVAQARLAQDED